MDLSFSHLMPQHIEQSLKVVNVQWLSGREQICVKLKLLALLYLDYVSLLFILVEINCPQKELKPV